MLVLVLLLLLLLLLLVVVVVVLLLLLLVQASSLICPRHYNMDGCLALDTCYCPSLTHRLLHAPLRRPRFANVTGVTQRLTALRSDAPQPPELRSDSRVRDRCEDCCAYRPQLAPGARQSARLSPPGRRG